jgi:hypothetical protein
LTRGNWLAASRQPVTIALILTTSSAAGRTREGVDDLAPGVLGRPPEKIVPAHVQLQFLFVPHEPPPQCLGVGVHVVSRTLAEQQPKHVGGEAHRAVALERAV